MAVSDAVRKKLETLKVQIQAFLKLHKNPYDSSKHNELATKLEHIESILSKVNNSDEKSACSPTSTGDNSTENSSSNTDSDNATANANNDKETTTNSSNLARSISASVGKGGTNNEDDVKIVQELLNKKGASLTVDGKIGNKTISAIQSFQSSLGMPNPDGLIEPGKNTWKGLIGSGDTNTNDTAPPNADSSGTAPSGTGASTDDNSNNTPTGGNPSNLSISASVGKGGTNNEDDVKTIQGLLNNKGGKLTVDGKIGNKTISAIQSFQSSLGMSNPDGLISPGKNTWKGLIGSGGKVDPNYVATNSGGSGSSFDPGEPLAAGARPSSSNFSLEEFCVSGSFPGLVTQPPPNLWSNVQKVFNNLEVIRAASGGSIRITSGYRNEKLNDAVGGKTSSKHLLCQASDIQSSKLSPGQMYDLIKRLMDEGKITPGGLGSYNSFTHYDIRGSFVTW